MTEFSHEVDLAVRFRDLDPMGHVNNAVYASYLEQARADYFDAVIGESLDAVDTVLVHLELDYLRPVEAGDEVVVAVAVTDLGDSAVTMRYEVRAGDEVAATAETVQVAVDREAGESRPVPAAWRRAIERHEGLDDGPTAGE